MRALFIALALVAGGCQMNPLGNDPIRGRWASDDGVFVATFNNGAFSSRHATNGDTLVADGRYARSGELVTLSWVSIVTNEERRATCRFMSERQVACNPSAGQPFTMTRVA